MGVYLNSPTMDLVGGMLQWYFIRRSSLSWTQLADSGARLFKEPLPKADLFTFSFVDLVHQNPSLEFPAHLGKIVIPRSLGSACSLRLRPMFCEIRLLTCFCRTSLSPRARAAPDGVSS